jgi:hypothetical protein
MNRDTLPGTNLHACTSILAGDIADRIAIACHPDEIEELVTDACRKHEHGLLGIDELAMLKADALARMNALPAAAPPGHWRGLRAASKGVAEPEPRPSFGKGSFPRPAPSGAPRAPARRPRPPRQRSPDRQASIERRRRLVASGPLPPPLAARFTWGEIAVMRIVGDECRAHGCCTLHIDAIAARAGVHRTTVQNALREAQGRGEMPGSPVISVQERRRRGQRSLTNIIRIINNEWLNWLHKGPSRSATGVGSKCTAIKKSNTTDTGLSLGGKPPWGIPDGVYSCEEVI